MYLAEHQTAFTVCIEADAPENSVLTQLNECEVII